jgi:hypothetical protein
MRSIIGRTLAVALLTSALFAHPGTAQTADQTILGPGLYVFQTRTRSATCADDERTGYVSSFVAPIHGVPGSRTMRMELLNTAYWSTWSITVTAQDRVVGDSTMNGQRGPSAPRNHFEVSVDRDRFTGTGTRTYTRTAGGRTEQCSVSFDALLRRIDQI